MDIPAPGRAPRPPLDALYLWANHLGQDFTLLRDLCAFPDAASIWRADMRVARLWVEDWLTRWQETATGHPVCSAEEERAQFRDAGYTFGSATAAMSAGAAANRLDYTILLLGVAQDWSDEWIAIVHRSTLTPTEALAVAARPDAGTTLRALSALGATRTLPPPRVDRPEGGFMAKTLADRERYTPFPTLRPQDDLTKSMLTG